MNANLICIFPIKAFFNGHDFCFYRARCWPADCARHFLVFEHSLNILELFEPLPHTYIDILFGEKPCSQISYYELEEIWFSYCHSNIEESLNSLKPKAHVHKRRNDEAASQ